MAITGLLYDPTKVIMRLGVVSVSTDGNTYYSPGWAKNIKIVLKPVNQKDHAQNPKTVGYTVTASFQMGQTDSADAVMTMHNTVNTTKLYVKILNSITNRKRIIGPAFLSLDETNLDFDGGEGYVKASMEYITDPTTAQGIAVGAAGP